MKKSFLLIVAVAATLFIISCGKQAEKDYSIAKELYDKKDYPVALENLDEAIEKNPKFSEAYFLRAKIKALIGDRSGALRDLDSTIKYNPKNYSALYQRGKAKAFEKNFDGAIRDYNKTLKVNPKLPDVLFDRGFAKYTQGDYFGAIDDYTRSLGLNPTAVAYCNRAIANDELGENIAALKDYNKAILINPKFAEAYFNRGSLKFEQSDVKGACEDWLKAADLGIEDARDLVKKHQQ